MKRAIYLGVALTIALVSILKNFRSVTFSSLASSFSSSLSSPPSQAPPPSPPKSPPKSSPSQAKSPSSSPSQAPWNNPRNVQITQNFTCQVPSEYDGSNTTRSKEATNVESIAFLFQMGGVDSQLENVWKDWFPPPRKDMQYHIYVHSERIKDNSTATNLVPVREFFCPFTIPPVTNASTYFAMMKLLKHAYHASSADYFVLLGANSMPLMSFDQIYEKITKDIRSSAICINRHEGPREWSSIDYAKLGLKEEHLAKSPPSSIFSRQHVEIVLEHETEMMETWLQANPKVLPEEAFLPTLLLREGQELESFCFFHYTAYDKKQSKRDGLTEKECKRSPCLFKTLEEGGVRLTRKYGYMFLERVNEKTRIQKANGIKLTPAKYLRQMRVSWQESQVALIAQQGNTTESSFDRINDWCVAPKEDTVSQAPPDVSAKNVSSIAFLFLLGDASPSEEVWSQWFPPANDTRYHVFAHTKPAVDGIVPTLDPFFCQFAIPSVPSTYYFLLEAMIQLISHAFHHSDASHFVFMSSTSIPLWNFNQVYDVVTSTMQRSSFCLSVENHVWTWNITYQDFGLTSKMLTKSELWSIVTRDHVEILLKHQKDLLYWNDEVRKQKMAGYLIGAPDEILFPTMLQREGATFHNCSIVPEGKSTADFDRLLDVPESVLKAKGSCCMQHFVHWSHSADDVSPDCANSQPYHPCVLTTMNGTTIQAISQDFMFLRKVPANGQVFRPSTGHESVVDFLGSIGAMWEGERERLP